nr:hypothetical protein [Escherichia coli]
MHCVTARLNKSAREFQAGESIGFNIRLGQQYYDRKKKTREWTNYSAVLFARDNQVEYYRSALVEGALVTVSSSSLKVDIYDGQNGQLITLEMVDAKLEYAHGQDNQGKPLQNSGSASNRQSNEQPADFDSDIPF